MRTSRKPTVIAVMVTAILITMVVGGAVAIASSGSIRARGAGWIETEDGDKAMFSVVAECEEPDTPALGATGRFTFRDRSEGITIRGTIVDCNTDDAGGAEAGVLNLVGTFTTSNGDIALADIALFDQLPDVLQIDLDAEGLSGLSYAEGAELGGGNIQIRWAG